MQIGQVIRKYRKMKNITQEEIANCLGVTAPAVSKWENGTANPDIEMLPRLAAFLGTTVDALVGFSSVVTSDYEERYKEEGYYWGMIPNRLCYEIMQRKPPVKPWRVLDIGCGEGRDAVFLAKNGYRVFAFDISQTGLEKGRELADKSGVHVEFFRADAQDYRPECDFDIVFSSGAFHFIAPELRAEFVDSLKEHTNPGGFHAINVFVEKPFIPQKKNRHPWKSGELFMRYYDWLFFRNDEEIFDCNSGGVPHRHCMDILVAQRPEGI